jgi:penicillin-binding protein 2B
MKRIRLKQSVKISFLSILIFLAGTLLLGNVLLLNLTGKNLMSNKDFSKLEGVIIKNKTIYPKRGTIYDSDGNILAGDVTVYKIAFILSKDVQRYEVDENGNTVLVDDYIKDPKLTADLIAPILNDTPEFYDYLLERLSLGEEGYYQVEVGFYGSNISYSKKEQIEALNLPGIRFTGSTSRHYPYERFASHLLGYVENQKKEDGFQIVGISGIEGIFNKELSGIEGSTSYYVNNENGSPVAGGLISNEKACDGYDITLTLNNIIQQAVEEALGKTMQVNEHVEKAWAVVMNAKTGEILGYGSHPTFSANEMDIVDYNDYCAMLPYEPGSTIKAFVYAAAINEGVFDRNDTFDCRIFYVRTDENGKIARSPYKIMENQEIHNYMGVQPYYPTFYEAFCLSYNVGCAVLLEKYIDQEVYKDYMDKFLFYQPVETYGIDEGLFYGSADYGSSFSIITTSFGQGMSATALQIMRAYSAFCNGGTMVKPYIVKSIVDPETDTIIYQGQKEEVGTPISEETAKEMLDLLSGVVNSGYSYNSSRYQIPGVKVGGKSGTAEVALPEGGYGNLTIHSMVIAMPIDNPQVLIYFAYQDWNPFASENISYINELERTVASVLGLSGNRVIDEDIVNRVVYREGLDNFVNHSLEYVLEKTSKFNLDVLIVGDGDTVISQYPAAGSTVISNQRIMILTNSDTILMPNMKGWSRKEVIGFWDMTGIAVSIEGYGYVKTQNFAEGTQIDKTMTIEVQLQ